MVDEILVFEKLAYKTLTQSDTDDRGDYNSSPCTSYVEIDHEIIFTVEHEIIATAILPLPLIKEEQLSVTGTSISTKY